VRSAESAEEFAGRGADSFAGYWTKPRDSDEVVLFHVCRGRDAFQFGAELTVSLLIEECYSWPGSNVG